MTDIDSLVQNPVHLVNSRQTSLDIWIEPWGDMVQLLPEQQCVIVIYSPQPGTPLVEVDDQDIKVWGWTGTYVAVWVDRELVRDYTGVLPVPEVPGGI